MTTDPRERLQRIDPAPVDAEPPSGAMEAIAVIHEIERRMGMEPRETTDQPTITSDVKQGTPTAASGAALETTEKHAVSRGRSRPVLVGAAAFVAVIVAGAAFVAVLSQDDGAPVASDDPAATIEAYEEAYNAHDIDAVMALFSEESVVTGKPFNQPGDVRGLAHIRAAIELDLLDAATDSPDTFSNVEVTGNTVTWDEVWTHFNGDQFCQEGHIAIIEDGIILTWTWPAAGPFEC